METIKSRIQRTVEEGRLEGFNLSMIWMSKDNHDRLCKEEGWKGVEIIEGMKVKFHDQAYIDIAGTYEEGGVHYRLYDV